ncbi:MAG: energy transducer TonB [Bacteroidia bacterium]|nr:energy transducer TonB [Bacteroidia bacterium]
MESQSVGMSAPSKPKDDVPVIDTMFFDYYWKDLPSHVNASYYRVFKKAGTGYKVEDRFINHSIQMTAFSSIVEQPLYMSGKVIWYNHNGYVKQTSNFDNNRKKGKNVWYYKNGWDSTVAFYSASGSSQYSFIGTSPSENDHGANNIDADFIPYLKQGVPNLHDVVQSSIVIPASAKTKKFNVKTYIEFTVRIDGKVENAKVKKSSGDSSLDNEALRVVNALPLFMPAKKKGAKIPFVMIVPVTFIN